MTYLQKKFLRRQGCKALQLPLTYERGSKAMYYVYATIFTQNPNGGYLVKVPDLPGCVTGGSDLEESMKMVKDALCGCLCVLEDKNQYPQPTTQPNNFILQENQFVALIEADTTKHRIEHDNRAVRKNVSLPAWLSAKAEQSNINCSQLLQEALRERLGV